MSEIAIIWPIVLVCLMCACVCQNVDFDADRFGVDDDGQPEFVVPLDRIDEVPCEFSFEGGRVCNCDFSNRDMVLPIMNGNINQIQIMNCKTLYVRTNTFIDLFMLRVARFRYIENLILEPQSLGFQRKSNRLRLEFENVTIEDFPSHAISGNIEVLTFDACQLGVIRAFFISGLAQEMFALNMLSSSVNQIQPQAFKKLTITQLSLVDVNFVTLLPSRAFYDMEISDFLSIRNCSLSGTNPGAFQFSGVHSLQILSNYFENLNGNSFQLPIKESIRIEGNTMVKLSGLAFQSITLDSDYFSRHSEALELDFASNAIELIGQPFRLEFSPRFRIKISKLHFIQPITCYTVNQLRSSDFFHTHAESIYFQLSDISETGVSSEQFNSFSVISQQLCIPKSYLLYIILGVLALILVLVGLLVLVIVLYVRKRRAAKQLNVVQPEGRTYRETQIVMQIENAGLLKTDL